jgi:outer membrane lipoprotein SlyB
MDHDPENDRHTTVAAGESVQPDGETTAQKLAAGAAGGAAVGAVVGLILPGLGSFLGSGIGSVAGALLANTTHSSTKP